MGGHHSQQIIWTAKGIGRRINASADYVRDTLAKLPETPVRRSGRRYYVVEAELVAYFLTNPIQPHSNR